MITVPASNRLLRTLFPETIPMKNAITYLL